MAEGQTYLWIMKAMALGLELGCLPEIGPCHNENANNK
jgi:hypothetical protein